MVHSPESKRHDQRGERKLHFKLCIMGAVFIKNVTGTKHGAFTGHFCILRPIEISIVDQLVHHNCMENTDTYLCKEHTSFQSELTDP